MKRTLEQLSTSNNVELKQSSSSFSSFNKSTMMPPAEEDEEIAILPVVGDEENNAAVPVQGSPNSEAIEIEVSRGDMQELPAGENKEIAVLPSVGDEENNEAAPAQVSPNSAEFEIEIEGPRGDEQERRFPNVFYDPVSGSLMVDPVVNRAGDSYDKSTAATTTTTTTTDPVGVVDTYYPNRALQNIIRREIEMTAKTLRGSILRIDSALQSGWSRLLENSAMPSKKLKMLPESFYCPITCELIADPVIAPDGNTYERGAIKQWIRVNGMSPLTRIPMTVADLRPNNALYDLIQTEKKRMPATRHPSIVRWKESVAETSRRSFIEESMVVDQQPQSPPPNTSYPTTEAELRARRAQRATVNFTIIAFIVALVVILVFIPYTMLFGLILIAYCTCFAAFRFGFDGDAE